MPSRASEFAHPDVIIGLSVLAYRYEGMRSSDFEHDVIELLRSDFEKACGPYHSRKPALQYRQWVEQAGGAVLGMSSSVLVDETDESKLVVPLVGRYAPAVCLILWNFLNVLNLVNLNYMHPRTSRNKTNSVTSDASRTSAT